MPHANIEMKSLIKTEIQERNKEKNRTKEKNKSNRIKIENRRESKKIKKSPNYEIQ